MSNDIHNQSDLDLNNLNSNHITNRGEDGLPKKKIDWKKMKNPMLP